MTHTASTLTTMTNYLGQRSVH